VSGSEFLTLRFQTLWMTEGLCSDRSRGLDFDDWFAPENTVTARDATAECWQCPIRLECLQYACETQERVGVLGGIPATERERLNHDFVWLSYEPNPYVRDRRLTNRSKFAAAGLKQYTSPEHTEQAEGNGSSSVTAATTRRRASSR
jgi:transcription factor WhiB